MDWFGLRHTLARLNDGGGEGERRALMAQDNFNAHIKLKDQLIMVIEHWNAPCDTQSHETRAIDTESHTEDPNPNSPTH